MIISGTLQVRMGRKMSVRALHASLDLPWWYQPWISRPIHVRTSINTLVVNLTATFPILQFCVNSVVPVWIAKGLCTTPLSRIFWVNLKFLFFDNKLRFFVICWIFIRTTNWIFSKRSRKKCPALLPILSADRIKKWFFNRRLIAQRSTAAYGSSRRVDSYRWNFLRKSGKEGMELPRCIWNNSQHIASKLLLPLESRINFHGA